MDEITVTELRQQIFKLFDRIIATGKPLFVKKNGQLIKIEALSKPSIMANLEQRECIVGDPDDLVELSWIKEWNEGGEI